MTSLNGLSPLPSLFAGRHVPTKLLADAALPVEVEADGEGEAEDELEVDLFAPVFPLVSPDLLHPTNEMENINASPRTGRGEYTLFITYLLKQLNK
ncbi:MAG: hypothetical protein DMF68_14985 [Acidobacteria bacterium]|nr:MAG: hypothetical protein DMF68_14985 [Acidobacteriota bacterium]